MTKRFLPYILAGTAVAISIACSWRHRAVITDMNTEAADKPRNEVIQKTVQIQASLSNRQSASWVTRTLKAPAQSDWRLIKFHDENIGWIGGRERMLYQTRDAGNTWTPIQLPSLPDSNIVSMSFVNSENGWLLLQKNAKNPIDFQTNESWLVHTNDGGNTWAVKHHDFGVNMTRVLFVDESRGWLVGLRWVVNERETQTYVVLQTSDQGEHWSDYSTGLVNLAKAVPDVLRPQNIFQDGITDITATSASEAVLLSMRGRVLRSDNGRQNWAAVAAIAGEPDQTAVKRISVDKNDLWVVGGSHSIEGTWGILARLDSDHWTKYVLSGVYLTDAVRVSASEIIACGSMTTNTPTAQGLNKTAALILYSSDGGHHWSTVYFNKNIQAINSLTLVDSKQAWAVGDGGLVLSLRSTKENP